MKRYIKPLGKFVNIHTSETVAVEINTGSAFLEIPGYFTDVPDDEQFFITGG